MHTKKTYSVNLEVRKHFHEPKNRPTSYHPTPLKKYRRSFKECHKELAAKCSQLHFFNDLFTWNGFFDISKRYIALM